MTWKRIAGAALFCVLGLWAPLAAQDYVVADGVGPASPWFEAVDLLAHHHGARVIPFDPSNLAAFQAKLAEQPPRFVALVLRPEAIDFNLARAILEMSTKMDEDPFVDFAFGYITGKEATEAVAFVKRIIKAYRVQLEPSLVHLAGIEAKESTTAKLRYRLRKSTIPWTRALVAGGEAFEGGERDREYLKAFAPALAEYSVIMFVGHGLPREVIHGPDHESLADLALGPSVVLNVACYTGVTQTWFEPDYPAGVMRKRKIGLDESFALGVLRAGALGYVAYTCPRPAGPELDCDLSALITEGLCLGEARRRDYDKTVLGFLAYGEDRLALPPLEDGAPLVRGGDVVRTMMLEGATGGILYGDPALRPFSPKPGENPVQAKCRKSRSSILVQLAVTSSSLFLQCSDPTARWKQDGSMAMKVHSRVPLGQAYIADVDVVSLRLGGRDVESRVVWGLEEDGGQRFAQVKVLFPRATRPASLKGTLRIRTTLDRAQARFLGGARSRPAKPSAPVNLASAEVPQDLRELACQRGISEEALQAAVAATAGTYPGSQLAEPETRGNLRSHGREGFRAVCLLIETGRHHYRTWELLQDTWKPGEESRLLELGEADLPGFASWAVLEGLGVADTEPVRTWLLAKLETTTDPGQFMSAAKALARLRERRATKPLTSRLLAFEPSWSGVSPHLATSLATIAGSDAAATLAMWILDPRSGANLDAALRALAKVSSAQATGVARELLAVARAARDPPRAATKTSPSLESVGSENIA